MARFWNWPRLVVAAACAVIVLMYCTNRDMGGDPDTPRGDGRYRPVLARGDGHMQYLMARSTALDGDWVFDNDLARFGDPWNEPRTRTGRKAIIHPIGPALVWTPLIWIAEGGAAVANLFGADIPMHGYTLWHQRFVFLSSALFGCGAVLLGRRLARKAFGGTWAPTYAAVAVLLGTSITYYATYMPSYVHAMDAFACAAFFAYWADTLGRHDLKRWCLLGVLLGIAALVRVQEIAMGVVVAVEVAVRVSDGVRRGDDWRALGRDWIAGGAIVLAVALVVFIPQLVEWRVVFGKVTELPQGAKYTRLEAPMVMELLFSARNGWFSTTPIAYAGVIGLCCLPRGTRLLAAGLLAAVAIQVYLNSTVLDWWGSAAFGQRRLCSVTLPVVVGLAALIWRLGRAVARWPRVPRVVWHGVLVAALGLFVAWNLHRVSKLSGGKAAAMDLSPTCCDDVPAPLRGAARWLYDRIGNPVEFPANALFALRHHVPMSRWDVAVGPYPIEASMAEVRDEAHLAQLHGVWRVGSPNLEPYLVGGWSAPQRADRAFRFTTAGSATVLVPNLMPYGQRFTVWLATGGARHATLRWNGDVVASVDLGPGWTPVAFDLPHIALHTNELTVEAPCAAFAPAAGWPASAVPVGVAVGDVEMRLQR